MKLEIRKAKQDSFCRCCDKPLRKGIDNLVYMYSYRNRGQNILLCFDCIDLITEKVSEYKTEEGI